MQHCGTLPDCKRSYCQPGYHKIVFGLSAHKHDYEEKKNLATFFTMDYTRKIFSAAMQHMGRLMFF